MEAHIYAMDPAAWVPIADLRYPNDLQRKVRIVGLYVLHSHLKL